jgi:hypothetical protein
MRRAPMDVDWLLMRPFNSLPVDLYVMLRAPVRKMPLPDLGQPIRSFDVVNTILNLIQNL